MRQLKLLLLPWIATTLLQAGDLTAHGFGSACRGGADGPVLRVYRTDDDPTAPQTGSLRWALQQPGARHIEFDVARPIRLRQRILIRNGSLTMDGRRNVQGKPVTIEGGALEFFGCSHLLLRHLRLRLGHKTTLNDNRTMLRKRPAHSGGLDCLNFRECTDVLVDHLSLSWSCDELISVVRCRGVTLQWCLLAEPLANPRLHPYGDRHAFAINASASTLTVHHCVFAHYRMRGPQFEANDTRADDPWQVRMEAVANVMFDYHRSGSRYTAGVEDHVHEARRRNFRFQWIGNAYMDTANTGRDLEIITRHGIHPHVRFHAANNWVLDAQRVFVPQPRIVLENGQPLSTASPVLQKQRSPTRLFTSPNPPPDDLGGDGLNQLLLEVGASAPRDKVDQRILDDLAGLKQRPNRAYAPGFWSRLGSHFTNPNAHPKSHKDPLASRR